MFAKLLLAAIALTALLANADPAPDVPGPGDTYKQGGDCNIEWSLDTTGKWTDMQIELKTGDNMAMVPLTVVTTIDATKETSYVWKCPEVSPNSAIYFYEFTSSSSTQKYWTTRFTITDENGNSTPPTQLTQPNGDNIPWGTGTLVTDSNASPGSSSNVSSLPPSSSSGLPDSSSSSSSDSGSSILSSSSRLSSTRTPAPSQTSVNTGSSRGSSSGDISLSVPKALIFSAGLAAVSIAFFL